jgi:YD repeat-containing protein
MRAIVPVDERSYSYAGIGYANPHAVTQIANGQSTTTYSYDNNGNLAQKTTDGVTTTYMWDYANRLIALGSGSATSTYGYDAFGSRVFQTTATSTTIYPFKWYSVASSGQRRAVVGHARGRQLVGRRIRARHERPQTLSARPARL